MKPHAIAAGLAIAGIIRPPKIHGISLAIAKAHAALEPVQWQWYQIELRVFLQSVWDRFPIPTHEPIEVIASEKRSSGGIILL